MRRGFLAGGCAVLKHRQGKPCVAVPAGALVLDGLFGDVVEKVTGTAAHVGDVPDEVAVLLAGAAVIRGLEGVDEG